jgi:hypothetical protein
MNGGAAQKLLEKMRSTSAGWGQKDFETLLTGFGFDRKGKKHDIYVHKTFPDLRISIPRHNSVKQCYARDAVKMLDELTRRLSQKEEKPQ